MAVILAGTMGHSWSKGVRLNYWEMAGYKELE